jgi:hypothetical protein
MRTKERTALLQNRLLPAWAHGLGNARIKTALIKEQRDYDFELTPEAVRSRPRIEWLRTPYLGPVSVDELLRYVGCIAPVPMWPERQRP